MYLFRHSLNWLALLSLVVLLGAMAWIGAADAEDPTDAKVEALLKQMTLDEKIGQMVQVDFNAIKNNKGDIEKYFIGSLLSGGGASPPDKTAKGWAKAYDEFQSYALKTRLKIPLIYGIDAVHGHNNVDGSVIFPHNIGLGAMRNPDLVEKAERVTAQEVAGTGINWAFAPCITVPRNIRWGRTMKVSASRRNWWNNSQQRPCAAFRAKTFQTLTRWWPAPSTLSGTAAPRAAGTRAIPSAMRPRCGRFTFRLHRRDQSRHRHDHGVVQQLERQEDARPQVPPHRCAQEGAWASEVSSFPTGVVSIS